MILGKHSGRSALAHRLLELGVVLDAPELDIAYRHFYELADRKKSVFDLDLLALLSEDVLRKSPARRKPLKLEEVPYKS